MWWYTRLFGLALRDAALAAVLPVDPFAGVHHHALRPAAPALLKAARATAARSAAASGHRRFALRYAVAVAAAVRPVDAEGRPTGPPFEAIVADLSTTGLRLLHHRFVQAEYLAVRLPPDQTGVAKTVVVWIVRAVAVGRYYEFAGPLVARCEIPAEAR